MASQSKDDFVAQSITAQEFADYLACSDTDDENSTLPHARRWVWLCKDSKCPKHGTVWIGKTNFLLHLYEIDAHRADHRTRSSTGRREISREWREERAFDFSDVKFETDWRSTEPFDPEALRYASDKLNDSDHAGFDGSLTCSNYR